MNYTQFLLKFKSARWKLKEYFLHKPRYYLGDKFITPNNATLRIDSMVWYTDKVYGKYEDPEYTLFDYSGRYEERVKESHIRKYYVKI